MGNVNEREPRVVPFKAYSPNGMRLGDRAKAQIEHVVEFGVVHVRYFARHGIEFVCDIHFEARLVAKVAFIPLILDRMGFVDQSGVAGQSNYDAGEPCIPAEFYAR